MAEPSVAQSGMIDDSPANALKTVKGELVRFLIVGVTTVLIDYLAYRILVHVGVNASVSKGVSFFTGTIFAFFANKFFTFKANQLSRSEPLRFVLAYGFTFLVNLAVHHMVMTIDSLPLQHEVAWFIATGCSTVLNFLLMKFFVFRWAREHELGTQ